MPMRLHLRLARAACVLVVAAWLPPSTAAPLAYTLLYDAAFVTQTAPAAIEIAKPAAVSITMQNTGLATWRRGDVFLATQEPQDNFYWCIQDNAYAGGSGNRVLLPHDVEAGANVTFDFTVKPLGCVFAASAPLRFRMLSPTAGTFGEETPDPRVGVTTAAEFVEQQVPTPVPAGAKVSANVTFRNTTSATWSADAGYALAPANGSDTTWSLADIPLPGTVAPGATVTIPMRLTAPTTTGTYPLQVQMSANGVGFGQVSALASIVVVPAGAPNFQGLWWAQPAASESGWGINFAHQDDIIFATWFTYDATGKASWLTMTALFTGTGTTTTFTGDIFQQTGPAFSSVPFNPALVRSVRVGTGTLTFTDATHATFDYVVNGVHQTKAITPQVFRDLPTCTFGLVQDLTTAFNYQDLWWAASESGWGIDLAHQGDVIFATWFTYAANGTPMWVSATAPQTAKGVYAGTIVRTTGPSFDAVPFDPQVVKATEVGTLQLTFQNGNQGTFAYTLDGVTQSKTITRQVFRTPGTICQ